MRARQYYLPVAVFGTFATLFVLVMAGSASGRCDRQRVTSLKDAITRLGTRKVGAIAQQIALINSMVQPDANEFDLRKFWGHSLACAIVADRVHDGEFVD